MLKTIKLFIDLLFPIECLSCGDEGEWLCAQCLDKIKLLSSIPCPVCKTGCAKGEVCAGCLTQSYLDGVIVAASYEDKLLDKAVHFFKYKGIKDLAEPLSLIVIKALKKADFYHPPTPDERGGLDEWILMPVPLHKKRERWRGYNQAELMTNKIAMAIGLNIEIGCLRRSRYTYPQMKLKRSERFNNIAGAFVVGELPSWSLRHGLQRRRGSPLSENSRGADNEDSHGAEVRGKKIILFDDIMTTGATLQECAKVLKFAGAKKVWGLVLARGE